METQLSWLEQPAHNRAVLGSSPRVSISPDEGVTFIGCRVPIRNKRELELDDENSKELLKEARS